jgi:lipoate-protein ligase A
MMIRLLPFAIADGATNMAADDTLAHTAANGAASLRFYGWSSATVSLGYFQSHFLNRSDPLLAPLPWVRRPSGGATLVHHHELTYAIALPAAKPWHDSESWLLRMHRIIARALGDLGLPVQLVDANPIKHGDVLCFQQFTVGDVLCKGHKIVGSAQRKYRQALMQHGSILLRQSEHTPSLPGIRELTGVELTTAQVEDAMVRQFAKTTGWELQERDWTANEKDLMRSLASERYSSREWNERR